MGSIDTSNDQLSETVGKGAKDKRKERKEGDGLKEGFKGFHWI